MDPRHIGSLTNLGVAFINKKDYDSAIKQFLLVCEIKPNDANNFVNVGVAYANKRDYEAALKSFARALDIDPNHAVALQMQDRCKRDLEKLKGISFFIFCLLIAFPNMLFIICLLTNKLLCL